MWVLTRIRTCWSSGVLRILLPVWLLLLRQSMRVAPRLRRRWKPQVALFERHGSAGLAVLEALFARAAADGVLIVADAKRGDIGSTMKAYADAWLGSSSPLGTDSVTLSPYLGFESLRPALDLADENDRGTFVLALTSNPEGKSVQHVGASES